MKTVSAILASALALAAGNDVVAGYSTPTIGPGQERARARLAAKLAANRAFYAGVSEGSPSRQRCRWLARKDPSHAWQVIEGRAR